MLSKFIDCNTLSWTTVPLFLFMNDIVIMKLGFSSLYNHLMFDYEGRMIYRSN